MVDREPERWAYRRMPIVKVVRTDHWLAAMYGIRDVLMFPPDAELGEIWEGLYSQIGKEFFIGPMFEPDLGFALRPFLEYFSLVDLRTKNETSGS